MPPDVPQADAPQAPSPQAPSPRALRAALVLCGLGLALYAATRLCHPIRGLGNADIAGILYEADILLDGGLPYVDTVEIKSPGTFLVFAAIFRLISREFWAVQAVYFVWGLLGAPALWLAARALHGRGDAGTLAAGAAVFFYLLTLPLFDLNYASWMAPAYGWAFACLLAGLRGGTRWHMTAGACAALAFLLKSHALVLAPAFATVWLWARRRRWPGATWRAWPRWLLGASLALAPLALLYGLRGALPELVSGLFPLETAREYTRQIQPHEHWIHSAWWKLPRQIWRVFPLLSWLGLAALAGAAWQALRARAGPSGHAPTDMSPRPDPIAPQLLLFAWSVVGCGLGGMRYYVHYLPQYVPALALLGAHPAAWRWLLARPGRSPLGLAARAPAAVLLGLAALQLGRDVLAIPAGTAARVDYRGNHRSEALGAYIRARTGPDDCIQVWGWAAWSVYYWSDRRACTPIFKVLGQVTEYNQNSLFTRSRRADFKPGKHADALLAGLRARPPAYFVRNSPFFPGVRRDPLDQFTELREFFTDQYVFRERFGRMFLFEYQGRLGPEELRALRGAPAASPEPDADPDADADMLGDPR